MLLNARRVNSHSKIENHAINRVTHQYNVIESLNTQNPSVHRMFVSETYIQSHSGITLAHIHLSLSNYLHRWCYSIYIGTSTLLIL